MIGSDASSIGVVFKQDRQDHGIMFHLKHVYLTIHTPSE